MATSRYGGTSTGSTGSRTSSPSSSSSSGYSVTSSEGTSNTVGTSSQQSESQVDTRNLSTPAEAELMRLIRTLAGGGTAEMRETAGRRREETAAVQAQRAGYSKEAAFGDAQGLIAQQSRRMLEQLLPSINRAAEDAGSSGGALRALLLQDAANKAAEASSVAGLNAAVQYGQVSTGLSQVMEQLTRSDPTTVNALTNALNVAKGATTSTTSTGSTTGQTTSNTNTTNNSRTTENRNNNTSYGPQPLVTAPASSGGFGQFGGGPEPSMSNDLANYNSTQRAFAELANTNPWSGYTEF